MPKRDWSKLTELPQTVASNDFVKSSETSWRFHWDPTVYIYRNPINKLYALVNIQTMTALRQSPWSVARGNYGNEIHWYKTKTELINENLQNLKALMVKGVAYQELADKLNGTKPFTKN